MIRFLSFGASSLSAKGEVVPNEKESEGGKKKKDDEEDLLTLDACSQINQEYPYSQGGVKGHHEEQQELERPAVGEKEMERQKKEDEDGGNSLEEPGPHTRQGLTPDLYISYIPL